MELGINTVNGKRYWLITDRYWNKYTKNSRTKTVRSLGLLEKLQEQYAEQNHYVCDYTDEVIFDIEKYTSIELAKTYFSKQDTYILVDR